MPGCGSCRARQPPCLQHGQTIILGLRRGGSAAGISIHYFSQRAQGVCSEVLQLSPQLVPWGAVGGPGGAGRVQGSCFLQERCGTAQAYCWHRTSLQLRKVTRPCPSRRWHHDRSIPHSFSIVTTPSGNACPTPSSE